MDAGEGKEWAQSAAAGLAAFVARTGQGVVLDRASADARYDRECDNPGGAEDARFLAEPMLGAENLPIAVIIATRNANAAAFSEEDAGSLGLLSACAAPTFGQILLRKKVQSLLVERTAESRSEIFRQEAVEHHLRNWDQQGDVLKALPLWLRRTYAITLALSLLGFFGMCLAKLNTYASGPALIRASRSVEISAPAIGLIRSLAVSPGSAVRSGDLLMLLELPLQASESTRAIAQIRATVDGTVEEIRVRPGEPVKSGDKVLSMIQGPAQYEVVAFLPEAYAPQLHRGMPVRLKLAGGTVPGDGAEISEISPDSLSPGEVMRYMGKADSESVRAAGRAVMIHASLPERLIRDISDDSKLDGMTGEAEVVVRSERVILALMPGLKKIFER